MAGTAARGGSESKGPAMIPFLSACFAELRAKGDDDYGDDCGDGRAGGNSFFWNILHFFQFFFGCLPSKQGWVGYNTEFRLIKSISLLLVLILSIL